MIQSDLPLESRARRPLDEMGDNSVVSPSAAEQPHFFMKLPLELRLQIWERICSTSRVVDVFSSGTGCEALHSLDDKFHDLFGGDLRVDFNASHCRPPAVLHVCHESRMVGLQFYTLAFGKAPFSATPPTSSNISFSCQIHMPPHIYINWDCDIVCPMGNETRDMKDMEVQILEIKASSGNMLRHLAIDPLALKIDVGSNPMDTPVDYEEESELSWAQLLMGCPKLKELILYHLPNSYHIHGPPVDLIPICEVDGEQEIGAGISELKDVRNTIFELIDRMEKTRNATDKRALSKVQEAWVPFAVRIMGVVAGGSETR
ncbi:hypothetical protein ONS95_002612 [Cadophora gregata]|uniref:uncharacterized protein n=1 Tax=Cadophora gregata TaxID=51156 RepID=UPI0026DDB90E|nr:uncharacterized protein ONS95_002612 [Cadophora gregata]KAK0109945.1 hypothetical protein ONS95_002612 [Cadophora gregata]KAK0110427.1 hypothetical protein ONS96_002039 [Cadophora gregata f. sp. sojae]